MGTKANPAKLEVRPCVDRLGHIVSYDLCPPHEEGATCGPVMASVFGKEYADKLAAAWNAAITRTSAEERLREENERLREALHRVREAVCERPATTINNGSPYWLVPDSSMQKIYNVLGPRAALNESAPRQPSTTARRIGSFRTPRVRGCACARKS